jgi:hypothetical protein
MVETLISAAERVEAVGLPGIAEAGADKGYQSNQSLEDLQAVPGNSTYERTGVWGFHITIVLSPPTPTLVSSRQD